MHHRPFSTALAGLPRHGRLAEIEPFLAGCQRKGYTGIWVENDYVHQGPEVFHPDILQDYHMCFAGNCKLFNIFDFTYSQKSGTYSAYLNRLMGACERHGLEIYLSFWIPKLSTEFYEFLLEKHPQAIGSSESFHFKREKTLSTCEGSGGLELLEEIVACLLERFPKIAGLKVACEDNCAWICDDKSPFANGTSRAAHTANMYAAVLRGLRRRGGTARLLVYPWMWADGAAEAVRQKLGDDYFIMSKLESGSVQHLGEGIPAHSLMDASIVSESPGSMFLHWAKIVGAWRIMDMVPVGSGIDDFFLNYPPYPGRLFRRFRLLRARGVAGFLDFECGGHSPGSGEEAVALFQENPGLDEAEFLDEIARRNYSTESARREAADGWRHFDSGFGHIPMGLGDVQPHPGLFSERLGFAWSMCIATPLVRHGFDVADTVHGVHFFSPYPLLNPATADRLELFFQETAREWWQSARLLGMAAAREPGNVFAVREAAAALAHAMSASSVLHWCLAARLHAANEGAFFTRLQRAETDLTTEFVALLELHPWLWANNCWQPHQTPLSQRNLSPLMGGSSDAFGAKLEIMRSALEEASVREEKCSEDF